MSIDATELETGAFINAGGTGRKSNAAPDSTPP